VGIGLTHCGCLQSSSFKVGSGELKSWTQLDDGKSTHNSKKARIEYGSFKGVSAWNSQPIRVHFEHSQSFMTFRMALREVEVSHWGAVSIEEHFELHNTGAELDHGFARVDMQNFGWTGNSFRELRATLPAGAKDIHFRDIIGNISSSHARSGLDGVTLEVEQRFPLFGGWKTDFYQTYVLPSENHIFVDSSTGEYVLRVPAEVPYREPVLDDYTLKVVLPEGATDVVVKPLDVMGMQRQEDAKRFTYLDTVVAGRPVLKFHGKNLVSQHAEELEVRYKVPPFSMLREPLLLSSFFFALFVAYSVLSRIDLSISPKADSVVPKDHED
jgi:oligosaccharyltransferase complex subunit alpha (ribophorin I)